MRCAGRTSLAPPSGFADAVTMIATPLYSNTTLVSFIPTLAWGGTVVLMPRFDAHAYLELAQKHRATHTMLVPVQYQRIMALPDFDSFDLTTFRIKTCTSAPFSAALKADIVARWPGALVEYYGMTEGGGTCILLANAHPDKLHTVGQPVPGHDIRLIDDEGNEVAHGEMGEVVGRSPGDDDRLSRPRRGDSRRRMVRRRRQPLHPSRRPRPLRRRRLPDPARPQEGSDHLGRVQHLSDRPGSRARASIRRVADCAVVGIPSEQWGETPVGFYVPRPGIDTAPADILAWINARVGKTQRLAALEPIDEMPRSAIGKVLKRELRDRYLGQ